MPQKVPVGRGYDKYRYRRWGGDCTVTYEEESDALGGLTVRGYLGEERSPGKVTGIGQADSPARCGWKVGRQRPTVGGEDEVCANRRVNVRTRVGGGGPDRRNTVRVHGAAGGVRGLWSANHINGVLSGERSHAKQQYGSPEEQHHQLFHRFSLCCNYAKWKTIRSQGNEISQFAYEAIRKLVSRNRSQLSCDQVVGAVRIPKMLVVILGLFPAASFIVEWPRSSKCAPHFKPRRRAGIGRGELISIRREGTRPIATCEGGFKYSV